MHRNFSVLESHCVCPFLFFSSFFSFLFLSTDCLRRGVLSPSLVPLPDPGQPPTPSPQLRNELLHLLLLQLGVQKGHTKDDWKVSVVQIGVFTGDVVPRQVSPRLVTSVPPLL